ncbi:MAG TPA: hypothetical protein PLU80_19200 [Acidobacteriota bacterium]|nr:hypothetical protein [Acidobacteriota bacterium]HNG96450.1 hypothetical protein [Acidobacteriota bacterium]
MLPVPPDGWPVAELIRLLGEVYLPPSGHLQHRHKQALLQTEALPHNDFAL